VIASGVIELVLGIWSFVAVVKCLAEVQRFSAWRALGSIFLVGVLIAVPVVMLILIALAARG
jgi:hypothetical protein